MDFEENLRKAGYTIAVNATKNAKPFEGAVKVGNLLFVSGHAGRVDGKLLHPGTVGKDVTLEEAQETAVAAFICCLRAVKEKIGDLNAIDHFVNIKGYVACTPDFKDIGKVMNPVTDLCNHVFGESGKHTRAALGMSALPGGTSVEVENIISLKD